MPFTYRPVAEQITGRLKELQSDGKTIGLDGAICRAGEFAKATEKLDELAGGWRKRFASDQGDEDVARAINRAMKRLGRLLVPLQSTVIGTYGHDPYGYTPQGTMIPCLYDIPQLAKLKDGEQRWMLETKVIRDRNRVAYTLSDSIAIIDELCSLLKTAA